MATTLTRNITREVQGTRGPLVVRMTPAGMLVREKGRRTWYGPISWQHVHDTGALLAAGERLANKGPRRVRRSSLRVGV